MGWTGAVRPGARLSPTCCIARLVEQAVSKTGREYLAGQPSR